MENLEDIGGILQKNHHVDPGQKGPLAEMFEMRFGKEIHIRFSNGIQDKVRGNCNKKKKKATKTG